MTVALIGIISLGIGSLPKSGILTACPPYFARSGTGSGNRDHVRRPTISPQARAKKISFPHLRIIPILRTTI